MTETYKITFYRPVEGDKGDLKDLFLTQRTRFSGLSFAEACETRENLQATYKWAEFFVVKEDAQA